MSRARAKVRVQQQNTGEYDFKKLQTEAEKYPPYMDHASYIGPIQVRDTGTHGRGVFTTKAVKAGDLLLCGKAFLCAYANENSKNSMLIYPETIQAAMGADVELLKLVVHKLYRNPSLASEFTRLYAGTYEKLDVRSADSLPVVVDT